MTDSYGPFPTEGPDGEPAAPPPPWTAPERPWAAGQAEPEPPAPSPSPSWASPSWPEPSWAEPDSAWAPGPAASAASPAASAASPADTAPYGQAGRVTPPPLGRDFGPAYLPPPATGWPPAAQGWPAGPPPPSAPGRGTSSIALAVVAAVIAAFVGVMIGSQVFHRAAVVASGSGAPATPFIPAGGGASATVPSTGSAASPATEQAVRDKVDVGVVDINTKLKYESASAAGTGMILTASGEVLTNNHVIDGATSIEATVVTTGRKYTARVVGTDPTEDVAIIQLDAASGLTPIKTAPAPVSTGDVVFAIGNAGGVGGTPSVSSGTVQAVNQTITASDQGGANAEQLSGLIQTNAPMQPGDSGGPLANKAGAVVGMDTAASARTRFESAVSVGFAIPISHALSIGREITAGHASATVHLGVPGAIGVTVDPAASGSSGAVVASVLSGGPAASAGLSVGDTITSVDGQKITSATILTTILHRHHPGDHVPMAWTDTSGSTHEATLTLMTGPAD